MSSEIYDDYRERVLPPEIVFHHLKKALVNKKPFSLIRIGRGETQLIGYVLGLRKNHRRKGYFPYTGVSESDYKPVTRSLIKAIKHTNMVGAGLKDAHHEFPMIQKILTHYDMKFPKLVCISTINRKINKQPFYDLLKNYKVILIGRRAVEGKKAFRKKGIRVAATYYVDNYRDIEPVMTQIQHGPKFDIALISAGVNAVILAVRIKKELGKVAIDFGHSLDKMIDGKKGDYVHLEKKYNKQKKAVSSA